MIAYFQGIGASTGVYSTSAQWTQITGPVSATSSLYSQQDWLAGAQSLSGAQSNCRLSPLTGGGSVVVTQWTPRTGDDGDYACTAGPTVAAVSSFTVKRTGSRLIFRWRVAMRSGIVGYNVLAGSQRLNRTLTPAHRSPRYTLSLQSTAHGPYRLQIVRTDGLSVNPAP